MKNFLALLVILLLFSNCKKSELREDKVLSMQMPEKKNQKVKVNSDSETSSEQKIIKNAIIRFETNDVARTFKDIENAVREKRGIVQNDEEGKDYNSIYRNLTIRIPNSQFDDFINDISKGVSYFERKEITSEDVTSQFIDIEARLKTKAVLENRYLELLNKAKNVTEILAIEKELSVIREEIESKTGQLKYLQNQVSYSTITIEFYKTLVDNGVVDSFGKKILNALKSGFYAFSGFLIGLITVWPFILLAVIVVYFIRKKIKKKK